MSRIVLSLVLGGLLSGSAGLGSSAERAGADWPRYNDDLQSTRHSSLLSITPANAARLRAICVFDTHQRGSFQSGLLAIGGTLYFTSSLETYAIDASTCKKRWIVRRDLAAAAPWPVNRGLAYADGRLFRATTDGHFIALDARYGKLLWDAKIVDTKDGGWISAAPVAWNGMVFVATAGADSGVNGQVFGIDASTGRVRWTFDTIDKSTSSQWPGSSARHGGGPSWSSLTLDPVTGELFVPIGNAAPDFSLASRKGGNAFTDSVVVIDAKTGRYSWRTSQARGDFHDWDTAAAPTLLTSSSGGHLLAAPSKDGHVYVVDRDERRILRRIETTTVRGAAAPLTAAGTRFCPGALGGTEWNGGSYDAGRHLFFVPAIDWCTTLKVSHASASAPFVNGQPFLGSLNGFGTFDKAKGGWLDAIDLETGRRKWRFRAASPMVSGVVSTDAGIVAAGDYDGKFRVYDSESGKILYAYDAGEPLAGGVVTYESGGAQRFAFTGGNTSRTPLPSNGTSRVYVFALNGPSTPLAVAEDPAQTVAIGKLATLSGQTLYANNCAGCHGASGSGAGAAFPPLRQNPIVTGDATSLVHIVKYGLNGAIKVGSTTYDGQMPSWAAQLTDKQIAAILTYIRSAWGNKGAPIDAIRVTATKR